MPELTRTRTSDGIDAIEKALRRDGAVVIESLVASDVLERIEREIRPHLETADPSMKHLNPLIGAFYGDRTRHVSAVPGKSPSFACELMCNPELLGLCDRMLLPSCARYQLNVGHVIDRGPASEAQWLHRDEDVWVHVPRPHPELQVACMVALTDFTADNGATLVVPGSHEWPRDRVADPSETISAEMRAGSAVVYLGSTLHGGGANRTRDMWRTGLHLSFVLGWLRTEENNILGCPPEVARQLPRKAQELLGYAVHDAIADAGGYLGMLELRDPVELLAEGRL